MPRILIIDDEAMIRSILGEILESEGYEIIEASNGQTGLDLLSNQSVDLVITDLMMPEKDGFETIRELKKTNPDVKIVALTGYGLHNLPIAYDLGASRIFEKPIEPKELKQAIKELLSD